MHDVEKQIGKWEEYLDTYILPDYPGICFELADTDSNREWVEREVGIEWISVFAE